MAAILLAEDDPVSGLFLEEALSAVGEVETASDGATALARAQRRRFDLLVLDVRLPGLPGPTVLARLRADPQAASRHTPALALSADLDPATLRQLAAAGFEEALSKPLDLAALHGAARRWLGDVHTPLLIDRDALAALGGRPDLLQRMRQLFADELPPTRERIASALAAGRRAEVLDLLHRLRAGCGFCGAPALEEAVGRLERALQQGLGIERALERLLVVSLALEKALRGPPSDHGALA